ncbi:MAG: glycosyltransferase [Anaerolineales bacterium]|nr:glycosyltransferase [Anaerolineales bacterium]
MTAQPLVSIITPSYNQAAYLEAAIRSVLAQDYTPIEYILVDGGSSDGSPEIIRRYADWLAWWVSEPDSGQAEAINKGLQKANGEIIAWLNSDDLYLPGAVGQAAAVLQAQPELGMVFADAITIDPQGRPLNRLSFGPWGLEELLCFRIICQPAVFMCRSVIEKAGFLDPTFHYMLDHQLWMRLARQAPIQYAATGPQAPVWAAARHHPGAKNVAQAPMFGEEILRLVEWLQAQPDLAPWWQNRRKHILGGAYRLNGRYLLDGGEPRAALQSYMKALRYWPAYTLKHWRRMLYALASLMSIKPASPPGRRNPRLAAELKRIFTAAGTPLDAWPGINLGE